jgi:hypothetical protein
MPTVRLGDGRTVECERFERVEPGPTPAVLACERMAVGSQGQRSAFLLSGYAPRGGRRRVPLDA